MLTDIALLCKNRNITLSQMAERCGVSVGYLSLIAKGKRKNVSYAILENLAEELDITVRDLLSDTLCEAPTPDVDAVAAVLNFWQVDEEEVKSFVEHFKEMRHNLREPASAFFFSYEETLVDKVLNMPYTAHQIMAAVIAALQDGSIAKEVAQTLFGDDPVPKVLFREGKNDTFFLTLRANHILKRFRRKIPQALDHLYALWTKTLPSSQAFFQIGRLCAKHGYNDFAIRYYGNAALYARGEEDIDTLKEAVAVVRKMPSSPLRKMILAWYKGMALSGQGLYEKAYAVLRNTLHISSTDVTEQRFLSRNHNTAGVILIAQGQYKQALHHLRESLRLWSEGPLAAATLVNMGTLMRRIGRLNQAEKYFNMAIESNESFVLPSALLSLAFVTFDHKDLVKARRLILESYLASKKVRRELGRTEIYVNLGIYYNETGKYSHAIKLLGLALQRATRSNDMRAICYAMLETADVHIRTNKIDKAQKIIDQLPQFIEGQSDLILLGFWLNSKAHIYLTENRPSTALTFLKQAYTSLGDGANTSFEYLKCIRLLEQAYAALKEPYQMQFYHDEIGRVRRRMSKSKR